MRCSFNDLCYSFNTATSAFIISNSCPRNPNLSFVRLKGSETSVWWGIFGEESTKVKASVAGSRQADTGTGSLVVSESNGVVERGERSWRLIMVDGDGGICGKEKL